MFDKADFKTSLRILLNALGAALVYFLVLALSNAVVFLLGAFVNDFFWHVTRPIAIIWVSVLAAISGNVVAFKVVERVFHNFSKRFVAATIFTWSGIVILVITLPSIAGMFFFIYAIAELGWRDVWSRMTPGDDLFDMIVPDHDLGSVRSITNIVVSSIFAWRFLWKGKPL